MSAVNGRTPVYDAGADHDDAENDQPTRYDTVEEWVEDYFGPMFLHRVGDGTRTRWCARWWDHPEAIGRLSILWSCWEAARWEPANKPGWWLDLDHHLPILLAADGPFRACRPAQPGRSARHERLSTPVNEPAPWNYWV